MRQSLIALCCLLSSLVSYAQSLDCTTQHCMAVVDLGSTGSRLRIYSYDLSEQSTATHVQEQWSREVSPGLASLSSAAVPNYLDDLFKTMPDVEVPVYFYGTAGMRLLRSSQQQALYQAVKNWASTQPHLSLKAAKTISGHEEGVYGWVATNYQLGRFEANAQPLVGVMDMGGASVQISFPVSNSQGLPPADVENVQIAGKQFTIFTHSFLGLGQTEVAKQLLDTSACYSKGYVLSNASIGLGEGDACEQKIDMLLTLHEVSQSVHTAMLNNPRAQWFVAGGLAMLAQKDPLHFDQARFTPETLFHEADLAFCQTDWSDLYSRYGSDSYLTTNCLSAAYYHALLVHGYGFSPQQEVEFSASNSVGEWPLGVVLLQR